MESLEKLKPLALLLLRLGLAAIFIYHGYPKLFTHTREALQGFTHMGFPPFFAYVAGVIEFFGGCLLVVGLFTRVASLLLAGEMGVALIQVHKILSAPRAVDKYEFPLALAVGAFALAAVGPGLISLDQAIYGERRSASRKPKNKG